MEVMSHNIIYHWSKLSVLRGVSKMKQASIEERTSSPKAAIWWNVILEGNEENIFLLKKSIPITKELKFVLFFQEKPKWRNNGGIWYSMKLTQVFGVQSESTQEKRLKWDLTK